MLFNSKFPRCLLVAFLTSTAAQMASAVADPHLVFSKLPAFNGLALSPDGTKAVALRAMQDTYHPIILDFEKGTSKPLMAADPAKFLFNWCRFANNTRVVCSIRSYIVQQASQISLGTSGYKEARTVARRLIAIDVDGGNRLQLVKYKKMFAFQKAVWNTLVQDQVVSWLPADPNHILLALARDDRIYTTVYKLNINTNKMRKEENFRKAIFGWGADATGVVRNGWGLGRGDVAAYIAKQSDGNFQRLDLSMHEGELNLEMHGYTADGGVIVSAYNGQSTQGLYVLDSASGAVRKVIHHDAAYDIWDIVQHPLTSDVLAIESQTVDTTYLWLDKSLGEDYVTLASNLPGKPSSVDLLSLDHSLNRMIVRASGNSTHPAVYMYDRAKKTLVALAKDYALVPSEELTDKQAVTYKARDGLEIPAYLSVPKGVAARGLPTIIFPHGGPYLRDTGAFDFWVQYFNNRGFAVLQPNFRGSAGYGNEFMRKGYGEWGLAMQDDLDDGLSWLVEQGIADPKKVCIVGASYGGYAALVASYKSADRYRCAVSFAGVTDLDGLVSKWRLFYNGQTATGKIQSGRRRDESSPIKQVKRVSIPLLLAHGDVDVRVRIEQSTDFVDALERSNKSYRYIELENGDHYLSLQQHRAEFFSAMDEFLLAHLGTPNLDPDPKTGPDDSAVSSGL